MLVSLSKTSYCVKGFTAGSPIYKILTLLVMISWVRWYLWNTMCQGPLSKLLSSQVAPRTGGGDVGENSLN